jgi:flagellar hook assembly protein FlgD
VLRKIVIGGMLAAALAVPSHVGAQPTELMPGVTYEKQVEFTLHGPVGVNVLIAPKPGGLWSLQPELSNEQIPATETLPAIEQRLAATATTAGVNGDVTAASGRPDGLLIRNGAFEHDPRTARTSIGVDGAGVLHFDRVSAYGYWQGAGSRHAFTLVNEPPKSGQTTLYTPAWGPATPAASGAVAVVLHPFPATAPNTDLAGTSAQVVPGGAVAIPSDGAVLVARGAAATALQAEAPVGQAVHVRFALLPTWSGVTGAVGGGPLLVRNGRPVFKAGESIPAVDLALREPRTAIGQLADGRIVLVSVDPGLPGSGVTNYELAQTLARLGAVTGAALGSGSASGMAFDGRLLSTVPRGGAPGIADALLVEYQGIVASTPSVPVLSPNADGWADAETFTYKVVRPSTVTLQLTGPDGVLRQNTQSQLAPGTYQFQWNGRKADGTPEQEGAWTFAVAAVDDLGRSSADTRAFKLDLTLGSAKTIGPALAVPRKKARPVASFQLARQARVTARIETTSGVVLRRLGRVVTGPGTFTASWDGTIASGSTVHSGRYVAHVIATSSVGTSDLTASFLVRRK